MFPFELSLSGTGLIITVAVLVILYLIVLIKLNPSTEGDRIPRKPLTERQVKPTTYNEVKEETVESIEGRETVSPVPVEIEKTDAHGCSHYFGYLGEYPKNTPIPNECLTCIKIMECLSKVG
jgi:hypothetical protein